MRTARCFLGVIVLLLVCSVLGVCSGSESTPKHQSPQEEAEGYYWYEGIFPEKEEVEKIFSTVSDDYPKYEFTPDVFHITTQYKPDPKHEELYGKPVTIRIIGYASGSVRDSEEDITSENEGLLVEISSTDEGMQALIDSCDKVWHITGSYAAAAKYTGQLDFSDYMPVDITIEGVFGLADSNGKVILEER